MNSLSSSQSLFTALVAEAAEEELVQPGGSGTSSSSSKTQGAAAAAQQQAAVAGAGGGAGGVDMVSLAYKQGRVVEVLCPDCGAHGVGVAVHLFR